MSKLYACAIFKLIISLLVHIIGYLRSFLFFLIRNNIMINNIFVHNYSHFLVALFPQNKFLEVELLGKRIYEYI